MELFEFVQLFAHTHILNGLTGDCQHGQCRTAAGVGVQLGHQHAVNAQCIIKCLCHVDGILTCHGIDHQHDLVGVGQFFQILQFVHELGVDVQTAGGIQDHHVIAVILGKPQCLLGNDPRIDLSHFKDLDTGTLAHHLQLVDRRRTVNIACHQQRKMPFLFQHLRQLGGMSRLTGALQAAHHDDAGRLGRELDPGVFVAHEIAQFLVDDLDDLLCRCQTAEHFFPDCTFGNLFDKILDDLVADIRFQQSHANFPHGFLDITFSQLAVGFQLFEHLIQFSGKSLKCHVISSPASFFRAAPARDVPLPLPRGRRSAPAAGLPSVSGSTVTSRRSHCSFPAER